MKRLCLISIVAVSLISCSAHSQSLWDDLLDVTEHRLKASGPDHDVAEFLSRTPQMWPRRETFFALSCDYLDGTDVAKISAALEVLYSLRGFQPMEWVGPPSFAEKHADFFHKLDSVVFAHYAHFKSLQNDDVYNSLSLYLGIASSPEARRQLKEIAEATQHNEQTLICITWQRNPEDMDFLLPFMLADTEASRILPNRFRDSYGRSAIPALQSAASEAKSKATREQAQEELRHFEH